MIEYKVKLGSISDVKEFTTQANSCWCEMDLVSGRYAVDAKSIMGIFSLDLTKTLSLIIHAEKSDCQDFLEEVKKFITD